MSAWDDLEEKLKKKQAESGIWLKLPNDKDKVAVVFLGEPVERETCFVDSKPVPIAEARARKLKIDTKIMFNVMILATKEVKVWEKGPQFYKDLMVVRHKY